MVKSRVRLSKTRRIPDWILQLLNHYGNCACGREIVKELGETKLLKLLKSKGYKCTLRIVLDYDAPVYKHKVRLPLAATYILETDNGDNV